MKEYTFLFLVSIFFNAVSFAQVSTEAKMNSFIDALMKKMTIEEKFGPAQPARLR